MKRLTVNLKILTGFAIAIACIGYFLFTTYKNAQISYAENKSANNQIELISISSEILDDMQDIETGYRGYIITNEESYLEPYNATLIHAKSDIAAIKKLTQSDPLKANAINSLNELVQKKILFSEQIISLCKTGNTAEAKQLLSTDEGKYIMDNIRTIIARLNSDAHHELNSSAEKRQFLANETRNKFLVLSLTILAALIIFYIIIISDLRKSEKVKKDLQVAGNRIRNLYDHAPSGYISVDKELKIIQINKTALKWLGYSYEELVGIKKLENLVNTNSIPHLQNLLTNETVTSLEIELVGQKKNFPVILDAITQRDQDGNVTEKRVMLTDISERKKAEEQSRYLATLIDQTSDAIFSTDNKFIIRSWNKGAENMYGFSDTEVLNKEVAIILRNGMPDDLNDIISELEEKGNWHGERTHYRKDGTPRFVYSSVTVVRDVNNKLSGYVMIVQDITSRKLYEEKLKNFNTELIEKVEEKTEEIYKIFERVTDGFISLDEEYKITYINTVGARMLGKEKSELIGKNLTTEFAKEDNTIRQAYKKAFETQVKVEIEDYYEYLKRWYSGVMYPNPDGVSIFFRDVTVRKEAELKMAEKENQYRKLFENNPLPMWVLDITTSTILDVNNAAINHYGYTREEFTGKSVLDIRPESEKQRYMDFNLNRKQGNENAGIWTHQKKDGTQIKVEILSYDTNYSGQKCRLIIANDITEKIKYEEELRNSRDHLRKLSTHLEKVREEERSAIAREVHDELGQQLTGLKMDLFWLSKKISNSPEGVKEKIDGMIHLVDDTVKSVRKIASELRPGVLDELGLTAALDWQMSEFNRRTGIDCNFKSEVKDNSTDKNISIGVFRILQEALTNVARHANATKVNCLLTSNDKEIKLLINDNGSGIKEIGMKEKTLGILGMRERALMMNGHLSIESSPGKGTKIELIVPLHAGNSDS